MMSPVGFLKRNARKEAAVPEPAPLPVFDTTEEAVRQVRSAGAFAHVVDGSEVVSKRMMLDAVAAELSFPEWAGRNLDALHDCLIDLSWLPAGEHVLVWSNHRVLAEHDPKAYRGIGSVLVAAAQESGERVFRAVCAEGGDAE
ncbi:Barstar (barnase inhibitor) [Actinopolyspora saharensis]|uniref:Barstar (Barnase inhibitor) n=2 Tax=Actinopolyspora saharensis TaxID=995062 RepID=A0A1H1DF80_9ACTN|nr:barstar family protein [Actinopolyspora sp. BKK1]SDQ75112.1 Barstar (barnase inhibitor) [Actinopolyspora saharensis]